MEHWFYRTEAEWTQWVERLKLMPCPHCQVAGTLNRHGILMGYDESQRQVLRARRVYCSNRHSQRGCGRTFSVWLADKIRRLSLSTHVVWRFVREVIAGSLAAATRAMAYERSDRTWQRLWKRFQRAQSTLRSALIKRCPSPTLSANRPEAQVIAHLQATFPVDCPLAAFQHTIHLFCL
ncbi:MAG: hypothetical protein U0796_13680 [Gemmatales bacterium]